jgi:hypothetical protein
MTDAARRAFDGLPKLSNEVFREFEELVWRENERREGFSPDRLAAQEVLDGLPELDDDSFADFTDLVKEESHRRVIGRSKSDETATLQFVAEMMDNIEPPHRAEQGLSD